MSQLEQLHALLQQVAFPETPEERDEAEKAIITLFSHTREKPRVIDDGMYCPIPKRPPF